MEIGAKRTYRIHDPLFIADVVFIVGKRPDNPHFAACTYTRECTGINAGVNEYVVELKNPGNFYGIVHECLHVVKRIFEDREIPFNGDNQEVIAYYQEWWVRKLWKLANKELPEGSLWK